MHFTIVAHIRELSKLSGMAIYRTLKVVLKPPMKRSQGVKSPRMDKNRVFPLLATFFVIDILSITLLLYKSVYYQNWRKVQQMRPV